MTEQRPPLPPSRRRRRCRRSSAPRSAFPSPRSTCAVRRTSTRPLSEPLYGVFDPQFCIRATRVLQAATCTMPPGLDRTAIGADEVCPARWIPAVCSFCCFRFHRSLLPFANCWLLRTGSRSPRVRHLPGQRGAQCGRDPPGDRRPAAERNARDVDAGQMARRRRDHHLPCPVRRRGERAFPERLLILEAIPACYPAARQIAASAPGRRPRRALSRSATAAHRGLGSSPSSASSRSHNSAAAPSPRSRTTSAAGRD